MPMRFRATIERGGTTATGVEVPEEVVESLGAGKRPKVRVKINGYTYRSSLASMGGRFMLGISADVRERAGVAAGDQVDISLELDTDPREVTVPADLQSALATDAHAKTVFEGLSYSRKQRHVLSIEGAKTDETRQRRIGKAIAELREGKG
jgi:L-fucose isomerase-like protein